MTLTTKERIEMDEASYGVTGLRGPDNRELYVIEHPSEDTSVGTLTHHTGAMWREPKFDRDRREAWVIVLPNRCGCWWTTWDSPQGMWRVTGEPPNITVHPSINAGDGPGPGNWHGWIKDGAMTP
jgi:hypothetical protein